MSKRSNSEISNTCPTVPSDLKSFIDKDNNELKDLMMPGLQEMTTSCPNPTMGGKKSRRKKPKRKKTKSRMVKNYKGGSVITLNIARALCYLMFLGILGGMMTSFSGSQIGIALYQGIFLGRCTGFFSRIVDSFGFNGSICANWNWYLTKLTEMFTTTSGFLIALTSMKVLIASVNSPIPLLKLLTGVMVAADTNNMIFSADVAQALKDEARDGYNTLVAQWTTITGGEANKLKAATYVLGENAGVAEITDRPDDADDGMKELKDDADKMDRTAAIDAIQVANQGSDSDVDPRQPTIEQAFARTTRQRTGTDSNMSGGKRRKRTRKTKKAKKSRKSRRYKK